MATEKVNLVIAPDDPAKYIRQRWLELAYRYCGDRQLVEDSLRNIQAAYCDPSRHYHDLNHISHMLHLSHDYQQYLQQRDLVDFAIFYHDIVYDVAESDNEERSAVISMETIRRLDLPQDELATISALILATKSHEHNSKLNHPDLDWFLDFDMAVLATDDISYTAYTQQLRLEYAVFPDARWVEGRKKFIKNLLEKESIFLTAHFRERFEMKARKNLEKELETLK